MMRKKTLFLAAVAVSASLTGCIRYSGHTERTLTKEVSAAGVTAIRLSFPVGEVTVVAADQPQVSLEVQIQCKYSHRCAEAARNVEIEASGQDPLRVALTGWPHSSNRGMKVRATVRVPRNTPLTAELGVGRMTVSGVGANLSAHLGVGDVDATLPEASIASVHLASGVGYASLRTSQGAQEGSRGLLSRSINWQKGTGKAAVQIDCGVGHAKVVLR
ncbi:MAG TPA: hypothetical protein VFE33_05935 [Thermoanaerobaculia bacterium]|nr:hypothetical protein [Thermoanaerobaculia bacterium]